MPTLKTIIENRQHSPFIRKEYRPWNLSGVKPDEASRNINTSERILASETNREQTEDYPATDDAQTRNKHGTIREQLGSNQVAIREQLGSELDSNQVAIREQLGSELDSNQVAIREQLGSELGSELGSKLGDKTANIDAVIHSIQSLCGIQRNVFFLAVDLCIASNSLETGQILTKVAAQNLKCSHGTFRNSLNRLVQKELVSRGMGKVAKSGFVILCVSKAVFLSAISIRDKLGNKHGAIREQLGSELGSELGSNCLVYNNSLKNTFTTTKQRRDSYEDLPVEWKAIDFKPLEDIGFSKQHILTLHELNNIFPEDIQESINNYAWGAANNPEPYKKYKNPLYTLIGVLKNGNTWIERGYESQEQTILRQMLQLKKQQKSETDQLIADLVELEFPQWKKELSQAQTNEIAPRSMRLDEHATEILLKVHFKREVLIPRLKKDENLKLRDHG